MNRKLVLIPLASLAVIGVAALLTIGPPTAPAPICIEDKPTLDHPEPSRRFARPPTPPPAPPPVSGPGPTVSL